eukprot:comp21073_c0_seq1/m.44385 comp21073_c0_seq1/g.44385  ORF comp21073_c0_seq1/g.44385 comp21073_c0_seq1/m.44385 type:complete len:180 (+) comp21073_c0_seq1:829-1368(+)
MKTWKTIKKWKISCISPSLPARADLQATRISPRSSSTSHVLHSPHLSSDRGTLHFFFPPLFSLINFARCVRIFLMFNVISKMKSKTFSHRLLVGLDGSRPAAWSCNMVLLAALTPAPSLRLSIAVPDPARQRAEISFPLDAGDVLVLRHPLCRFRTQQENEVFLEIEMAAEEWSEAESS